MQLFSCLELGSSMGEKGNINTEEDNEEQSRIRLDSEVSI